MIKLIPGQSLHNSPNLKKVTKKRNLASFVSRKQSGNDDLKSESYSSVDVNMSSLPLEIDIKPLLNDMAYMLDDTPNLNSRSRTALISIYKDMYYHDPIAGSCVDLFSTLPFSDFTLGGISSSRVLNKFTETLERLNTKTLLNELSVDYLVTGAFISSLLYDRSKNSFLDILPHRLEDTDITPLPFYSQDPIIRLNTPKELRNALSDPSDRIKVLKESLGEKVVNTLLQGRIELDPLNTVFIPRKTFTSSTSVSYYRRILPLWLIEKNLYRGTLVESSRRQRGILHLTLGDGEEWEPSVEDLNFMTELFMNADADPLGAIIATRSGVSAEEMRQGGDFWKITDVWDSTAMFKLRALGISETFLSGDATYSTAESSMTVFIESMRAYRDNITRKLFYNKIFPLVSLVNGYTLNRKGKLVVKEGLINNNISNILDTLQDGSKLLIPTIHWNKQLKPEGDSSYMDILNALTEAGVPVPLRAFAAAGGFNLDEILQQKDDDIEIQKRILEYAKEVADLRKQYGPAEEEAFASTSSVLPFLNANGKSGTRSTVHADGGRKPSILEREWGELGEISETTKTGKRKHVFNQSRRNRKINETIVKSMKNLATVKRNPLSSKTITPKKEK